jgi:hypothetical protein
LNRGGGSHHRRNATDAVAPVEYFAGHVVPHGRYVSHLTSLFDRLIRKHNCARIGFPQPKAIGMYSKNKEGLT